MAVTYNKPTPIDEQAVRFSGTSNATIPWNFRLYLNGVKREDRLAKYADWEYTANVPPGEGVLVEVLDNENAIPAAAFPGKATLNWVAVDNAVQYRVEEYVSGFWTELQTFDAEGRTAFVLDTRWLEDQTTHQFRVIPISGEFNEGTPLSFSFLMVRIPDYPVVDYAFDAGMGKVTLTEAA